jgi:arginine repressor
MRTKSLLLTILFALGLTAPALAGGDKHAKSHDVAATVVAVDTSKNMITIKGADGKEASAPVEGDAQKQLAALYAGDKVTVTCRDNEKGEHVAVSAIRKS